MKIQLEKGNLSQVLQKIQSVTEKKTSMPILANVLIKATDEQTAEFSVTDLELSLWTQIGAMVEITGETTVSARKLFEIVRELPQDQVVLETLPNEKLVISSGRARFELSTIPPEDFPSLNFYKDVELVKVDASLLKRALGKTLHSVPVDEDSFSISGTLLQLWDAGGYRFVSTDGHRLSYYEVPQDSFVGLNIQENLIIPRKGVQEILRVIEKEDDVVVGVHERYMVLRTPSAFLSVQLLDAVFPGYQAIIPSERPFSITVDWQVLFYAIKRIAVLTDNVWRHARFVITKGTLELDAGNPEFGHGNETLDVDYDGDEFTVAFNIRYLMETLQAMESSQVRFEWVDQYHGGIFIGPEDPGFLSLIMPMVV